LKSNLGKTSEAAGLNQKRVCSEKAGLLAQPTTSEVWDLTVTLAGIVSSDRRGGKQHVLRRRLEMPFLPQKWHF